MMTENLILVYNFLIDSCAILNRNFVIYDPMMNVKRRNNNERMG